MDDRGSILGKEYLDIVHTGCGDHAASYLVDAEMSARLLRAKRLWACFLWLFRLSLWNVASCGIIIFNLRTAAFKAYCAIWVRRSNFRHQASSLVSPRESTQRRKMELWARNVREFCLNVDFHVTFMNLLHFAKLRHGSDGFISPPKEGVLRIFSP